MSGGGPQSARRFVAYVMAIAFVLSALNTEHKWVDIEPTAASWMWGLAVAFLMLGAIK